MTLLPVTLLLRRRLWCVAVGAWSALVTACATSGYAPGSLSDEQLAACRAVAQAFVDAAPEHAALRDELRTDPLAAAWYMRWLEVQIVRLREGAAEVGAPEPLFGERAEQAMQMVGQADAPGRLLGGRPESAAMDELAWFGELAVPVVVADLLSTQQAFLRRLGIELLVRIGEPALPTLLEQVRSGDSTQQSAAARVFGEMGAEGQALAALRELTRSPDWRVRADAVQSLHRGGEGARELLVQMLADEDPFVRKKAAATLGFYRQPAVVRSLAAFLVRCQEREDLQAEVAAQNALQVIAGRRGLRSAAAWLAFADQMAATEAR